jgi:hypothetical protein
MFLQAQIWTTCARTERRRSSCEARAAEKSTFVAGVVGFGGSDEEFDGVPTCGAASCSAITSASADAQARPSDIASPTT